MYRPNGGDILDMLGFVGDVGAGGLVYRDPGHGSGDRAPSRMPPPTTAPSTSLSPGLLNFISVADAYHIAIGKKP